MASTDMQEFRAEILKKQQDLQQRLDKLEADLSSARSADFAEQVTERENDDVVRELARETRDEIRQINKTIICIDDDEYGYCETCGVEIPEDRLNILPYSSQCVGCAEKAEQHQH